MLEWAKDMTWQGMRPGVALSRKASAKGLALGTAARQAVEARWQRDLTLPKYDMVSNPASTSSIRKFFLRNRLSSGARQTDLGDQYW